MCDGGGEPAMRLRAPPRLHRDQALFLDFDGTLVEIAPAPDLVQIPAKLPGLLGELADRLDGAVAVVSGRPLAELTRMLAPFAGAMAGQHGLERRRSDGSTIRCATQPELGQIRPAIAGFAARHDGVILEDKGGSLALHYRQAPSLEAVCRTLLRRAACASGGALEAVAGKMVIELMPRSGGKGRAITNFLLKRRFTAACRYSSATTPPMSTALPRSIGWAESRYASETVSPWHAIAWQRSTTCCRGWLEVWPDSEDASPSASQPAPTPGRAVVA